MPLDSGPLRYHWRCAKLDKMTNKTKGGRRTGAGRPKLIEKRKMHGFRFFDNEWALIRQKAKEKNISPRAYLYSLVEKDNP